MERHSFSSRLDQSRHPKPSRRVVLRWPRGATLSDATLGAACPESHEVCDLPGHALPEDPAKQLPSTMAGSMRLGLVACEESPCDHM